MGHRDLAHRVRHVLISGVGTLRPKKQAQFRVREQKIAYNSLIKNVLSKLFWDPNNRRNVVVTTSPGSTRGGEN